MPNKTSKKTGAVRKAPKLGLVGKAVQGLTRPLARGLIDTITPKQPERGKMR